MTLSLNIVALPPINDGWSLITAISVFYTQIKVLLLLLLLPTYPVCFLFLSRMLLKDTVGTSVQQVHSVPRRYSQYGQYRRYIGTGGTLVQAVHWYRQYIGTVGTLSTVQSVQYGTIGTVSTARY